VLFQLSTSLSVTVLINYARSTRIAPDTVSGPGGNAAFSFPAISFLGRIWPPDIRLDLREFSIHILVLVFSADAVK